MSACLTPPGKNEASIDEPIENHLVRFINKTGPHGQHIPWEYGERDLKRFSELYNAHNLKPLAFVVSDPSIQIATDGKIYYIVLLELKSAAVSIGGSWGQVIKVLEGMDLSLPQAELIESIGGRFYPLDEEERMIAFPPEEVTSEEKEKVRAMLAEMEDWGT
ncbi:hypothetical protein TWF281_002899 [Arthrobotrys megalospora]